MQNLVWSLITLASALGKIDPPEHYTNEWVVQANVTLDHVKRIAEEHGYNYIEQVSNKMDMVTNSYYIE